MAEELEYRYSAVEIEGRELKGVVMKYGEISPAHLNPTGHPEKFLPGSFDFGDVILNVQHDRGRPIARTPDTLFLVDSPESLTLRADVPETREGTDTLLLVKQRILRGLSVEFRAVKQRYEAGVRVIEKAVLSGIGLVDKAAYSGSTVEARAIPGVSMNFTISYNSVLQCECCDISDEVLFVPGAFDEALQSKEILAVHGDYKGAIASRNRGTLRATDTKEGLAVETNIADTQAGRDLLQASRDVTLIGRPIVDFSKSERALNADGVAVVKRAHLRAFLIGPTDADKGWDPIQVKRTEERKVHIWL